jgi:signal transduction histidine kinase
MPRRGRTQVRLMLIGLLTWALSGTAGLATLHSRAELHLGWAAAQAVFGLAFWVNTRLPWELKRGTLEIAALAVEVGCALVITAWSSYGFEPALFVIIAGQAPFCLSLPHSWLLVVGQTAAAGLISATLERPLSSLGGLAMYLSLQVFALGAATLAISEFRSRRALLRVHAELMATQTLLAENSRHRERLRIARGLHDDLGHQLTALSLQLEVASHCAQGSVVDPIVAAQRLTRELLSTTRTVVGSLRAEAPIALEIALRSLASGMPHPRVHLTIPEDLTVDDPAHAETVFHCVQEALTNAARHSDARNVWVSLVGGLGEIEVQAHDDGRGTETITLGHGLTGMRERLEQIGGRLDLHSAPGAGFTIHAWVPRAARGA